MEKIKLFETDSRNIIYKSDFKEWLKEHRGLLKSTIELIQQIKTVGEQKCNDNICATCVDINQEGKKIYSNSFKIETENRKLFLKVEYEDTEKEGAYEEMQDTILAKETVELSGIDGVRVVNPLLGYTDKNGKSYFVAEWIDMPILDEVLDSFDDKKKSKIFERLNQIRKTLEGYRELSPANMFYDKERDEIVLFDLHL